MKRLILITLCMLSLNVYADKCDNSTKKELLKEANEIKVDYDEVVEQVHIKDEYYDYMADETSLNISIYNLTDNMQLEISNDYNDSMIFINKDDYKDGKYTFKDLSYLNVIKYKIEVYSNTSCDKYLVKTINYTKPMYNYNYSYQICKDNSDISICQKYVTSDKNKYSMGIGLEEAVEKYKSGEYKNEEEEQGKSFLENNYMYITVGIACLATITGIIVYINKKRSEI